jgi:carbonic anhydrase
MDHSQTAVAAAATLPLQAEKPQALVFSCIDYRFRKPVKNFVKHNLGIKDFDLKTDAGSVKQINASTSPVAHWVIENFQIAIEHHQVPEIVMFVHFDCAAYGGNKALGDYSHQLAFLQNEMRQAITNVRTQCAGVKVSGYVVALKNDQIQMLPVVV